MSATVDSTAAALDVIEPLDDATLTELTELEADEKVGPLAKAMAWLMDGMGKLAKGGHKPKADDAEDDGADDDADEDDTDDQPDDAEDDGDYEEPAPARGKKMAKSAAADGELGAYGGELDLDADAFRDDLIKSLGTAQRRQSRKDADALLKSVREIVAPLADRLAAIEAKQDAQAATQSESLELQKSLDQDLAAMGKRPRAQPLRKGGGGYGVAEQQGDGPTPAQLEARLTNAAMAGRLSAQQVMEGVLVLNKGGRLSDGLMKSLQGIE